MAPNHGVASGVAATGENVFPPGSGWVYDNVFQSGAKRPPAETRARGRRSATSQPPTDSSLTRGKDNKEGLRQHIANASNSSIPIITIEPKFADDTSLQTSRTHRRVQKTSTSSRWSQLTRGSTWRTVALLLACVSLFVGLGLYARESVCIGFCDAGMDSNSVLEELRARVRAPSHTNNNPDAETQNSLLGKALASAISLLAPDTCTPCPLHSTCTPTAISCERRTWFRYRTTSRIILLLQFPVRLRPLDVHSRKGVAVKWCHRQNDAYCILELGRVPGTWPSCTAPAMCRGHRARTSHAYSA